MNVATLKWLEIVRFEMLYQLRRWPTWFFLALYLLMLFGQTNGQVLEAAEVGILFYAPLFIAEASVPMGLFALLVMAAIAGDAATRDVETRMEPLMHAAPLRQSAYLGGRFTGAFLLCALLQLTVPLALILARFVHPDLDAAAAGPMRPIAFVQTFFILLMPNTFIAVAFMFAAATTARHAAGSYTGATGMFLMSILSSPLVGHAMGRWELAKVMNPSGHTTLGVMFDTWPPADLNARLIGLSGGLLSNRLLWLTLACGALAFTFTRFRKRLHAPRARGLESGGQAIMPVRPVALAGFPALDFGAAARVRQTLAIARDSMRELATPWSLLILPFLALQGFLITDEMTVRGTPMLPTTGRILAAFNALPPPIAGFMFFFSIFFAGELVWRERDANVNALGDAAPVPNWVRFTGKLLCLWSVILIWQALLVLSGIAIQLTRGWYAVDLPLYLQAFFGLRLAGPLAFALFVLSFHVLVNQKHAGIVAVVVMIPVVLNLAETFGFEHPLQLPVSIPGGRYSLISKFDPHVTPFLWLTLYWALWTLIFAIAAATFWVRGVKTGFGERVRIAARRFRGVPMRTAAAVLVLILLVGGFVFYNTNVLNAYETSAHVAQRQVDYERRYKRYAGAPQLQMTATQLHVEIYPDAHDADVRGVHQLTNRTTKAIDTIHVATSSAVKTGAIDFGRPARATLIDDDLGHRTYVLGQPLQPGESLRMSWQVRHDTRGFTARGISTAVVSNGTFIEMTKWMPLIGYQEWREIDDAVERKDHGLPVRPRVPSLDNLNARQSRRGHELFDLDVTVGTASNQTAVAPGLLRRTWTRDNRRYFHYVTDAPISLGYAIFSADYLVRKGRSGDVELEILHVPQHTRYVDRLMRSLQASVDQYTKRFGPYPYRVLRMVEYVRTDGGAHAEPGVIWFSEALPLLDPPHDKRRIDLPFGVVAHEVGHQFQPKPARVEGIALLSESFAWYSAMGVIEEEYGAEHLGRFLDFMRREYLNPRSRADVPLLRASDWFLGYRKGPFAMYALREYVGQEKVDSAWRRVREQHGPPFATSLDLLRELKAVTPGSLQYLIGDLIERNTFWELKTTKARTQQTANGAWQVTLDVVARKVVVDTEGAETNMPMNDLVEIGAFEGEKPLALAMHRIRTGPQTITITVPRRPSRAGIDPRHLLIDVEMTDNVADFK